jgi:cyanophycin synthetase
MKVDVLQGINMKNPITTVVINLKIAKKDIFDFYKKLHPLFMDDYKITEDSVEITTKIPFFWSNKTLIEIIEEFSKGKVSFEEAKKKVLELTLILVHSMSTIPILKGAHKLGYETFPFYTNRNTITKSKGLNRHFNIGIGKESVITQSSASSGDSKIAKNIQRDKWLTNRVLDLLELDIASWATIDSEKDLPKVAKEIGFPMVIKPGGLTGGACVKVGIKDYKKLKDAYKSVLIELEEKESKKISYKYQAYQKQIIAQKMVSGDDFRVLVINGKVEVVTNRIPARVTGDGKNTIKKLVAKENTDPRRDITLPTHTLKPIKIDKTAEKIIKEQGYTLSDIPPKDKIVQIRKVASMSQGGITEDYTDKTHPQIKLICESIASSIHSYVLGIDVLCKDISKPLTPENGCIIEVNTMPESYLNAFPVIGKQYPKIGEKIVRGLIDPQIHTNRITIIGRMDREKIFKLVKKNLSETGKVGLLEKGSIFIDDHLMNDDVDIPDGLLALKRNKILDTIVIHYEDEKGFIKYGMGFDTVDVVAYDKSISKHVEEKIKTYNMSQYIGKLIFF